MGIKRILGAGETPGEFFLRNPHPVGRIIMNAVPKVLPHPGPERGLVYRDLDGQLVRLVKVTRNLCTWVPIVQGEAARQVTHRDYFVRRFTPLKKPNLKKVA